MALAGSELGDAVHGVEALVADGDGDVGLLADVAVLVGDEDADHVVVVEDDHEAGDQEEEPGDADPEVDDGHGVLYCWFISSS